MKYLVTVSETYRIDNKDEVSAFIEAAKNGSNFELKKYNCEYKEKKIKGEVVDAWYRVTLVKSFNDEKEPDNIIEVNYEVE